MLNVFSYTEAAPLDETEEARLILVAKGHAVGDPEAAKMALIEAYGPALRAAVHNFGNGIVVGRSSPYAGLIRMGNYELDVDDLQSSALVGFLSLIEDHDPEKSPRLAGRVASYLTRHLSKSFGAVSAFAVPTRTLERFYGILQAAEGDAEQAEALAPSYEMSADTFRAIYAATRNTGSLDAELESTEGHASGVASPVFTPSPVADVEDRMLVDMAFGAMTDEEARICELAYGFTEYDPVPDPEIAHRMGLSKATVQRKRQKALDKSRKAIGVTFTEEV
jgi:DNA-directed RNA polymerase specialized sigma subunit